MRDWRSHLAFNALPMLAKTTPCGLPKGRTATRNCKLGTATRNCNSENEEKPAGCILNQIRESEMEIPAHIWSGVANGLRYFGGMEREEVAAALGLTLATVKRDLRLGEAWLRRFLAGENSLLSPALSILARPKSRSFTPGCPVPRRTGIFDRCYSPVRTRSLL